MEAGAQGLRDQSKTLAMGLFFGLQPCRRPETHPTWWGTSAGMVSGSDYGSDLGYGLGIALLTWSREGASPSWVRWSWPTFSWVALKLPWSAAGEATNKGEVHGRSWLGGILIVPLVWDPERGCRSKGRSS